MRRFLCGARPSPARTLSFFAEDITASSLSRPGAEIHVRKFSGLPPLMTASIQPHPPLLDRPDRLNGIEDRRVGRAKRNPPCAPDAVFRRVSLRSTSAAPPTLQNQIIWMIYFSLKATLFMSHQLNDLTYVKTVRQSFHHSIFSDRLTLKSARHSAW
jgi:hypothetical protein